VGSNEVEEPRNTEEKRESSGKWEGGGAASVKMRLLASFPFIEFYSVIKAELCAILHFLPQARILPSFLQYLLCLPTIYYLYMYIYIYAGIYLRMRYIIRINIMLLYRLAQNNLIYSAKLTS
jgi:hypothetical protein